MAEHPKLDLLIKLLSKSTTDNDNEAMMAIRAANRALKAEGWSWEQLLRGRITVVEDPFVAMQRPTTNATHTSQPAAPRPAARPAAPRPRPPSPPPPPQVATRDNQYPGNCYCCGTYTAVRRGFIFLNASKWEIACSPCATFLNSGGSPPPRRVRPQRMSVNDIFS